MALKRLATELKKILAEPNYNYSVEPTDDFLIWDFIIIGPQDTIYEGGIFKGHIVFPKNYPISPPKVYFKHMIHPNVFPSGEVCISILHEGSDIYSYEKDYERWSPLQGVNSIMLSIISMLSDPNFESPANTDYSVMWRDKYETYCEMIYRMVAETQI